MNVMNWVLEPSRVENRLSLTDLQAKLFPVKDKLDRAPVLSEDKYTAKTLEGNWFERRADYIPQSVTWRTTYDTDYTPHVNKTWKENQVMKWDNKLNLEGLAAEKLLALKREYYNNMTTTHDLSYNILPKDLDRPRLRTYNARQRKWVPEQDLTKSYGNLTQFGLKDELKEEIYRNSDEGIAKCHWWTTYSLEIGRLTERNVKTITKFNRRKVDFNVPNLKHFERKSSDIERCLLPYKNRNLGSETEELKI